MRRHSAATLLLAAAFIVHPPGAAAQERAGAAPADTGRTLPRCDGRIVSRLEIRPAPPPFGGAAKKWQTLARAVGLHHATTRPQVVRAFLALREGEPCTELRRAESERILRAQPFIADAVVRAIPDDAGGVRVVVETTDEIGAVIGGRLRGFIPDALVLGNSNVAGEGLRLEAGIERARNYRTGYLAHLVEYAALNRPYTMQLAVERRRIGHLLNAEVGHPFFTDLQRISWHAARESRADYLSIARPARDELALRVADERWDASTIVRIFGTGTVGLLGVGASNRRLAPDDRGIVVADEGFQADTGTTLLDRYHRFAATRVGVIGGLRRVRFHTVTGFDALVGSQDVASGAMLGLYGAHGMGGLGERDAFVSSALYAGVARHNLLLAHLVEVEARRDPDARRWDSIIGSARTALYLGGAPGTVFVFDDQISGGRRSLLPMQLRLDDSQGGILGYHRSAIAGAVRNVARAELRFSSAAVRNRADMGVATFAQVGSVWAGDAPYGTTATRATLGVSLLAAYPTRSKRLYRMDVGFPLTRAGEGGGRLEVRFSSEDRTGQFWREPDDVSRARTGSVPASLFAYPTR